ncbi:hypothetical protein BS47DRAFT_1394549 [Hydnum rufescens UP504]|uniref:F-box domain-containing protein n=1 Tax=Hydnum rufescens UP504 TaxID=1448309 RepID=A0A9P6DVW9_9AGAM|nr:hypothetical protein BS47DRAFT_1394549 [Hydnum rufescens UP504]
MAKIDELSHELILSILEYLRLPEIALLSSLSKDWSSFVQAYSPVIYRQAAILHGWVQCGQSLKDSTKTLSDCSDWLDDAMTWRDLWSGQRFIEVDRCWNFSSNRRPGIRSVWADYPPVLPHRIKLDPEERTVLSTTDVGGIIVRCEATSETLWSLSPTHVRSYAHLEYSNGFMIFDRPGNCHEVWVRKSQIPHLAESFSFEPDLWQQDASQSASLEAPSGDLRGQYAPYAVLHNPSHVRAYRFVYPFLLVASEHNCCVFIWDVPSRTVVETFSLRSAFSEEENIEEDMNLEDIGEDIFRDGLRSINYVELSSTHVFVCFSSRLAVFERGRDPASTGQNSSESSESRKTVLELPRDFVRLSASRPLQAWVNIERNADICPVMPTDGTYDQLLPYVDFRAVHVSPDGQQVVAVTREGVLFYIREFSELVALLRDPTPEKLKSASPQLWLLDTRISFENLAFDGARIAFSTVGANDT